MDAALSFPDFNASDINETQNNMLTQTLAPRKSPLTPQIHMRRHRKVLRDNISRITKNDLRRLARRGGVKRMSSLIYEESRGVLKCFLENVIRDATIFCDHAKRKTISALDIVYSLKRQGKTIYGFGTN